MHGVLIAFAGPMGAGKSTATRWLVTNRGFTRVRFAGPLKAMMAALGLSEREIEGDLKEAPCDLLCGQTPRYAMQRLGTEYGRDLISPDLWTTAWRRAVEPILAAGGSVVAEDCRFANEAAVVRELGGEVIQITNRLGTASDGLPAHISERCDFEVDVRIFNCMTPKFFEFLDGNLFY